MFQEERLFKIMELLRDCQTLTTNDIVDKFKISRDTARRDIIKLTEQAQVIRTHGGITLPPNEKLHGSYNLRLKDKVEEKTRIGKMAASMINPGQICYFDASTTVLQMCQFVPDTVEAFSNSLNNVEVLDRQNCVVHIMGGKLNHNNKFIYGYETIEQVLQTHYDIAFLGADGIDETGFYSYKQYDASLKKAVASMADKVVVLTEVSKFENKRAYKCFPVNLVEAVITDKEPDAEKKEKIEAKGTKVIIA